jgi:outer membrane immunogenic protein
MKWGAVIGGVALAALASLPARAADMTPIGQRAIPATSGYIPAQFFWTGFYIGAGIGGGSGTATFADPFFATTASPSLKGFLVGGVTGINYQIGSVVLGVEGDFTGSWAKGSAVDSTGNTLQTQVYWTASITGRFGVAFDRLLVYGKGGAAFDYDKDTVTVPASGVALGSTNRAAWTVGGGLEYAVTEHWTGRIEYDYFRFPAKGFLFTGGASVLFPLGSPPALNAGGTVGINLSELKFIMAYKF